MQTERLAAGARSYIAASTSQRRLAPDLAAKLAERWHAHVAALEI